MCIFTRQLATSNLRFLTFMIKLISLFILLMFGTVAFCQEKHAEYRIVDSLIETNTSFNSFKAVQILESSLISDTTKAEYWIRYAKAVVIKFQFDKANELLDKALLIDPNNAEAYFQKGLNFNNSVEYKMAVESLDKAISLNPRPEFYFWRGVFYQNDKNYKMAINEYKMATQGGFENVDLYNNLAISLSKEQLYKEGLEAVNKALDINPNFAAAFSTRSILNFFLFNLDESCVDYKRAVDLEARKRFDIPIEICNSEDNNIQIQYAADLLAGQKMYQEALVGYLMLEERKVITSSILLNIGYCYYKLNSYELAEDYYLMSMELSDSESDLLYENISLLYYDWEKYEKSIEYNTKRIKLNPNNHNAYLERGGTYRKLKKYDLALKDFNKSLEIKPDFFRAYAYRAYLNNELKNYEKAMVDAHESIRLNPSYGYGHLVLAFAKFGLNGSGFCADLFNAKKYGEDAAEEMIQQYCN